MDKTLVKGLEVLEALALGGAPRGVSDLAREMGLTRSNTHRTLRTLVGAGYVRQDEGTGHYGCTTKLARLAASALGRVDLKAAAGPAMERLAAATRETVHLSVLDGLEVCYLHKIDSPEPVRAYSEVGGRAPAHCVATGKALLAFQDPAYLGRFPERLAAQAPGSLRTRARLRAALEEVRAHGYAINRGEWRKSVHGLAAPIFDAGGHAVAAIGISGPVERLRPARVRGFVPDVVAAARAVSRALGCAE
jgi:DNA-binding IclR family transcriptional regulator